MHEHITPTTCCHELKFCSKCDEVYCEKCQSTWKKPSTVATLGGIGLSGPQFHCSNDGTMGPPQLTPCIGVACNHD